MHNKNALFKAFDTVPHDGILGKLKHSGYMIQFGYVFLYFLNTENTVDGKQSTLFMWLLEYHKVQYYDLFYYYFKLTTYPSVVSSKVADHYSIYINI